MRRLVGIGLVAAAAAVAAVAVRALRGRSPAGVSTPGNGHAADEARIAMLRERIAAARRRLRNEVDTIRGE
jgi:hypothetical protein